MPCQDEYFVVITRIIGLQSNSVEVLKLPGPMLVECWTDVDKMVAILQVVAKKRVHRKDDVYTGLDNTLSLFMNHSKDLERFIDFSALDCLQYLRDEMSKSTDLAQKILCLRDNQPSADGLALLVASLSKAGTELLPASGARLFRPSAYGSGACIAVKRQIEILSSDRC